MNILDVCMIATEEKPITLAQETAQGFDPNRGAGASFK